MTRLRTMMTMTAKNNANTWLFGRCVNKKFIDKAAEEFCYLNNTGTRRRLAEVRVVM